MTMFRILPKNGDTQNHEPADRFDARLQALSSAVQSPFSRRESPFERVRRQPRHQEA
jgi:hypothetical protein